MNKMKWQKEVIRKFIPKDNVNFMEIPFEDVELEVKKEEKNDISK